MKTTRRGFFKTAGLGTAAGLIGGTTLITPSVLHRHAIIAARAFLTTASSSSARMRAAEGLALAFLKLSERTPRSELAGATLRIMCRSFRMPLPLISTSTAVT